MTQFIQSRNNAIRAKYREKRRGGMPQANAIAELKREYSAFELSEDTIRQIVTNQNYGKTIEYGIAVVLVKGEEARWLLQDDGKPYIFTSKKDAGIIIAGIKKGRKDVYSMKVEKYQPVKNSATGMKNSAIGGDGEGPG